VPGQTPDWGLIGSVFNISGHSAGIFWRQPAQPVAVAAELVVAAAVPDEQFGALAAVVVAAADVVVARLPGAAARALPPAGPDVAVVAVQPGVAAQRAEFAASARRAE
jgi:hypothetical protein